MPHDDVLAAERAAFDRQVRERMAAGWLPDLRHVRRVEWFYNNVWREPEFVELQLWPKVRFVLDAATRRGGRVLELGCGCGYLTLELARCGLDVTGIDLSPVSIEVARQVAAEHGGGAGFGALAYHCQDIHAYDFSQGPFDTVVFFGTLHHFDNLDSLLTRVWQAMSPGGSLVVAEPVRQNFTRQAAELAAILRAVLPTWIDYDVKLAGLDTSEGWSGYVDAILDEYTYRGQHVQSPCDNATASEATILTAVERRFRTIEVKRGDAFVDKLIGGLRGEHRFRLARFLKFLDDDLIRRGVLPATHLMLHAARRDEAEVTSEENDRRD